MKVSLIDIDGTLPNLALVKLDRYYSTQGAEVTWDNDLVLPHADKIFVSCLFRKNKPLAESYRMYGAEIGGTGYNNTTVLPKEIYDIKPRINLDFATRGCIRKCPFCFVPEKEGKIVAERDLYDIWDGHSKDVVLMDNNILALPDHFKLICKQLLKEGIRVDFNQGLDIRLVNDEIAQLLRKIKKTDLRFALDDINLIKTFKRKLRILDKHIPGRHFFVYVYFCRAHSFEDVMERLLFLKENKCRPYLMRDDDVRGDYEYNTLASWVNQTRFFMATTYEEFKKLRRNRNAPIKNQISLDV